MREMNNLELQYRIKRLEFEMSSVIALLITHNITTLKEFKDNYDSLRNNEENKTEMDQLEYGIKVAQMAEKDLLSEEDEKYIREANTWDDPKDVDEFINSLLFWKRCWMK